MVLVGGRASVRNAAETFGLERELMGALGELDDAWRSCQTGEGSGRHRGRHRGPRRSRGREPLRTTGQQLLDFALITGRYLRESPITAVLDLLPHPREVREGQAPHCRDSGPQAGRSRFPLRREEDVGFVRVAEFKAKIDVARCWTCSRSPSGKPGSSSTPVLSEKLVTDNVVSRLKSNRTRGRSRTPSRKTSQWDTPWSLLRLPDPGRPTHYGEVASPGT